MAPLLEEGREVRILDGYYRCRPVRRGDVVVFNLGRRPDPLIKVVKAVPGDKFKVESATDGSGRPGKFSEPGNSLWRLLINGSAAKNSKDIPYVLSDQGRRMLELYARDFHGVVPKDAYIVMGDMPNGSMDSSRFGLLGRQDIIGKVTLPPRKPRRIR